MDIRAAGATDIGKKRKINEDSFGVFPEIGLYMVADGMGGHAAGEVASALAVQTLREFIESTANGENVAWPCEFHPSLSMAENRLIAAIQLANHNIHEKALANPSERGMGTTLVAVLVDDCMIYVAHVGDSRAYLYGAGGLKRLTEDHSYVQELVHAGTITQAQTRTHPMRNIITRALGTKSDIKSEITELLATPGELILLCTDGLTGMLTDEEIGRALADFSRDPEVCLSYLIQTANQKGGDDNITAVLLKVSG